MWIPFFILLSCQTNSWSSLEDCKALEKGDDKDNCWSVHLVQVFSKNREQGLLILKQEISSQRIRDFLLLEITREVDPTTQKYCNLIQDKPLADRCKMLVSRPHLHRETLRGNEQRSNVPTSNRKQ